jgi:hypothetical protein
MAIYFNERDLEKSKQSVQDNINMLQYIDLNLRMPLSKQG